MNNTIQKNSFYAWILAARPKTLTGAIIPVLMGSALSLLDQKFSWIPALVCLFFAGLMQIAANFINDLYDYLKGSDREDRLGPERACAQGWISPYAMYSISMPKAEKSGLAWVICSGFRFSDVQSV